MSSFLYPWLETTWQQCIDLYSKQKLPHAFLICGEEGVGKLAFTQALAQFFLCTALQKRACGKCQACHLFQQGNHPDYYHFGESFFTIDECREIIEALSKTAHQANRKVVTLFKVDQLSITTANALLKTMEEPEGEVVFILTAKSKWVLPTLKSRCCIISIPTPPKEVTISWLKNHGKVECDKLKWYLQLAGRSPLKTKNFLESVEIDKHDRLIFLVIFSKEIEIFYQKELQDYITTQPQEALYLFYYRLNDFVRFCLNQITDYLYKKEESEMLTKLAKKISLREVLFFIEKVIQSMQLLANSANKHLIIESLFYQWRQLTGGKE